VNISGDLYQILPLIVLWGAACVILMGDVLLWKRSRGVTAFLSLASCLVTLWLVLQRVVSGDNTSAFHDSISNDPLALITTIALLVTASLSILLAWSYLKNRGMNHGEYYVLLILSVTGAMLMASANDLIILFIGLEILSFSLYILAGFSRNEVKSQESSLKYFLLGAFASAFLLYGIAMIYGGTGSINFDVIAKEIQGATVPNSMLMIGIALLLVGLGFKAAVIPFHQWTPDVYEGAPTSVTAYMAGAAKIGAFAAILRVFNTLMPFHEFWVPAIYIIAVLTMVFGNLLAITQTNVKRMLAYSSIAHAGYLLVAVVSMVTSNVTAHDQAIEGALFYLFAYIFMTIGAFGVLVYLSNHDKDYQTFDDIRGLARRHPLPAYLMMFFMLSLGGIPPTMGFVGKWLIFIAAIHSGQVGLAIVMALVSVAAVYYYLKVVWMMCFEAPTKTPAGIPANGFPALLSITFCAIATVLFGVLPDLMINITGLIR
jgi:NADH-quinone oxidoreductase subunit N